MLTEREADFVAAIQADLGRNATDAWLADVAPTVGESKYARKHLRSWMRPGRVRVPLAVLPGRAWYQYEPLGVVTVIGAWNYPVYLTLGPLVGALAAGNCVVLKPSEHTPEVSRLMARLIPQYLDADAVAVVEGGAAETQELLEQRLDHCFYTGGPEIAKKVMATCAKHLTPVTLELGGKSPAIVAADADIKVAARRIAWGKLLNSGQTCIAPDHVLVERSVRDAFVDELTKALDTMSPSPDLPLVHERRTQAIADLIGGAGGRTVRGGAADPAAKRAQMTVIVDPAPDSKIMSEEIFGPVLPVVTVDSIDDVITRVNDGEKPLAVYLFSSSRTTQQRVLDEISNGGTVINHLLYHLLVPALPFGGVGNSGTGSYHGHGDSSPSATARPSCASPRVPTRPWRTRRTTRSRNASCGRSSKCGAELAGRTMIMSGGSRGIGLAIGIAAARLGANVALLAKTDTPDPRLPGTIHTAAAEIEERAVRRSRSSATSATTRRSSEPSRRRSSGSAASTSASNNASALALQGTEALSMKKFDLMMGIQLRGTFGLTRAALPHLRNSENPHVLTLSPPLNITPKWLGMHPGYTLAKYGMSLLALGLGGRVRRRRHRLEHAVARVADRHRGGLEHHRREGDAAGAHARDHGRRRDRHRDAARQARDGQRLHRRGRPARRGRHRPVEVRRRRRPAVRHLHRPLSDACGANNGSRHRALLGTHSPGARSSVPMSRFRAAVEAKDIVAMEAALDPGVIFRSPAVFTPYEGRDTVIRILGTVLSLFEDFRYTEGYDADGGEVLHFAARVGTSRSTASTSCARAPTVWSPT